MPKPPLTGKNKECEFIESVYYKSLGYAKRKGYHQDADECGKVGASYSKTFELMVEMYPVFYFNFYAHKCEKIPMNHAPMTLLQLKHFLENRKIGKKPSKTRK